MLKGLATNHERFGELSALALVGQVSQAEYQELLRHLESCAACRDEYRDFAAILSTELPLLHQQPTFVRDNYTGIRDFGGVSAEMLETSSANPETLADLPFGSESPKLNGGQKLWPLLGPVPRLVAAVCLGLIVAVVFLSFGIHRRAVRERGLIAALSSLNTEVARLRGQIPSNQPVATPSVPLQEGNGRHGQVSELAARAALEAQLKASKIELQLLKNELEAARSEENDISARASEVQEHLEKTGQELEAMVQERNQAFATIQNKQQELDALDLDLKAARDSVDRDRRLLAAGRDIRDLMGARNLRIIDVFDVDGKGRTRRPFGRVFFTEGKLLVFYAFDLDREPPSLQAAAFQGWASRGPYKSAAQSLGIFYRDDQTTNRWFLKFDDPQVLAEIDSVFVTIEPPGGSRRPTGARLLSAYLKADLNHP